MSNSNQPNNANTNTTEEFIVPVNEELKEHLVVFCPHCDEIILLEKLNCCIFRHGVFKQGEKQMNPHASKEECDEYIRDQKIYGCGKPFRVVKIKDEFKTQICDYI